MMLEVFADWMNKTMDITDLQNDYDSTTGKDETSQVTVQENVKCALFLGSTANQFISDRFKGKVDGTIIADPASLSITLTDHHQATIDNVVYTLLEPDDILFQGEVLSIPVKRLVT